MNAKPDVYETITARIIESLEAGTVPWHKPWTTVAPTSLATGRPYRGINVLLLSITAQAKGYTSPYWATFKQVKERGGTVRKGEKATAVILWRWIEKEDKDAETGEMTKKRIPFLRYYNVFNVDQTEGVARVPEIPTRDHEPIARAEEIVADYVDREHVTVTPSTAAWYCMGDDEVGMPAAETFESGDSYYAILFHELTHSTRHPSRLDRKGGETSKGDYAQEELVAEIGACFLVSETGVEPRYEQSAAYVASWLKALQDDRKLVVYAAAQAQNAADLILGRTFEKAPETTNEPVGAAA
jgi:antirestriction protein ArdC